MDNTGRRTKIPAPGRSTGPGAGGLVTGWLVGRALVMGLVVAVAALAGIGPETHPLRDGSWLLDRFAYWDSYHYVRIAEQGYLPPGLPCCDQAFFPGYPLLMAAVRPLVLGSTVLAGLVVSVLGGVAAALLLARLAVERTGRPDAGRAAVLWLAVAPATVFLTTVYTEGAFLACAVGAWLAASRRHWWPAGLAAAGASALRVNGLFLLLGLAVLYAVQLHSQRARRPRSDVLALALPVLPVVAYAAYLHSRTGRWNEWRAAEAMGWSRHSDWPWAGLVHSVHDLVTAPDIWLGISRAGDLLGVMIGVVLLVVLVRRRWWAEAAYVAPGLLAVMASTIWESSLRYALTWFPAYVLLGGWSAGRAATGRVRLALVTSTALAAVALVLFATRHWVS